MVLGAESAGRDERERGEGPTVAPTPGVRTPLRRKLVALTALTSALPLAALGWVLADINAQAVATASRELQIAVSDDLGRTIEALLDAAVEDLGAVASALTNARLSQDGRLEIALSLVAASDELDHVAVYDAKGEWIDTLQQVELESGPETVPLAPSLRERAQAEGFALDAVREIDGRTRLPIVRPLRGGDEVTGYVASSIDLAAVDDRVDFLAGTHFPGLPNALFVADEQLRAVARSGDQPTALESMAETPPIAGLDPATLATRYSQSGEFDARDGTAMVGTFSRLPSHPWLVGVQIPRSVAYASLTTMYRLVLGSTVAVIVVAFALGFAFASRVTQPVGALTRLARALGQRKFGETAKVQSDDELGLLAHAMSRASVDLAESEAEIARQIEIRRDLGRYLPGEIVERVVARQQDMALGGTRREITVMFADVVAFTPLTEKLAPEDVVQILNELFTISTEIIFRHGGTVDKFIGDCVMAIWNAPADQSDHAQRAVAAAEEVCSWLEVGNAHWRERYGVTVEIAIGINTGEAVVGNIGSETRMEYTAIGDAVNVAARLESIARPQQILITGRTAAAIGDRFELNALGRKSLAGHAEDIELYEVRA